MPNGSGSAKLMPSKLQYRNSLSARAHFAAGAQIHSSLAQLHNGCPTALVGKRLHLATHSTFLYLVNTSGHNPSHRGLTGNLCLHLQPVITACRGTQV